MQPKHFLLIDGNSVMFAAAYGSPLMAGDIEVTAIYGFLNSLRKLCDTFPDAHPIVLWDSGENWRKEQCPEYKANRDENEDMVKIKVRVKSQRADLAEFLVRFGIPQLQAKGYEADDLAGVFSKQFSSMDDARVTLISSDKDWLQLVGPKVNWYCPRKAQLITDFDFAAETGYNDQAAFLFGKAMQGDQSDNLKGVEGIGEKASMLIANRFENHKALGDWLSLAMGEVPVGDPLRRWNKKIQNFVNDPKQAAILLRNFIMMDLRNVEVSREDIRFVRGQYDSEGFKELLAEFNFLSILNNYEAWARPILTKSP